MEENRDALRLAVVAESTIGRSSTGDSGFTERYRALLAALSTEHRVLLVYLEVEPAPQPPLTMHRGVVDQVKIVAVPNTGGRASRLATIALTPLVRPVRKWEQRTHREIRAWNADAVLALAWAGRTRFRSFAAPWPSVAFVEEDISSRVEPAESKRGRVLQLLEARSATVAARRYGSVVVINDIERPWAEAWANPRSVYVVPHALDADYWVEIPQGVDRRTNDILVVGHMADRRNGDGLRLVAEALLKRGAVGKLRLLVASWSPLGSDLDPFRPHLIDYLGRVEDLRPLYATCGATLVPSFDVTGAKTTILQGWATGCPVVTTAQAARTVGGSDGHDLLAGADAAGVADRLMFLLGEPTLADQLAANARVSARTRSREVVAERTLESIHAALAKCR